MQMELLNDADLGSFLDTHGDQIYTYLCALCRDEDRAADALQSAYVKFLDMVRRGKVQRATAPQYLQKIAKNEFLSQLKREKKVISLTEDDIDRTSGDSPPRQDLAQILQITLMEFVASPGLPQDLALVVQLRFLEGAEVSVICERTGRSQATVYRLMEKALPLLADACRKAGIHPEDLGL